jgi:hypothetical protein
VCVRMSDEEREKGRSQEKKNKREKAMQRTYINNLKPLLEQLIRLLREMILYAILRRLVSLINVNPLPWATELCRPIAGIGRGAADGVVEYENASCAGAGWQGISIIRDKGVFAAWAGWILTHLSKAVPPQDNTLL